MSDARPVGATNQRAVDELATSRRSAREGSSIQRPRKFTFRPAALVIARLTLREALRKKMIWGVMALSAAFALLYAWGFVQVHADFLAQNAAGTASGADGGRIITFQFVAGILVSLGLYTINFLSGVMTIFAAVGTVASEVEAGTFQAIVPKPLARWEIILGKYLGFAAMIAGYVAIMATDVFVTAYIVAGYWAPNSIAAGALVLLVSLILLALTMLGSTILPTMANGVVVFMLYGMALLGGLLEQLGSLLTIQSLVVVGVVTSLLLPSDVIWQLASYLLQPAVNVRFTGPIPIAAAAAPSPLMVVYAVAYCVVLLTLAAVVFTKRDL